MREDGLSKIETFYRLRGYSSPGTSGGNDSGEAKFIIEGIVRRKGADPKSYLARSRLERSLYIQNWVDITQFSGLGRFWLQPITSSGQFNSTIQDSSFGTLISTRRLQSRMNATRMRMIKRLGQSSITASDLASRIWPVIDQNSRQPACSKRWGIKIAFQASNQPPCMEN